MIENKHKQQTNIKSIFEHIIESNGNGNISKIFLKIEQKDMSQAICQKINLDQIKFIIA